VSIDEAAGDDEEGTLGELIPDVNDRGPEAAALETALHEETERALATTLNDRERLVLRLRFGLNGGEGLPLEVIGRQLGVTRERVRQIEAIALQKLRQSPAAHRLHALVAA
jgi:RNA polymerase primary sigma factor